MSDPAAERQAYEALQAYTLAHGGAGFIHQHAVDAWAAQHADERTRPIGLTFALVGLYLHVERGFSGRLVQRVHMQLAKGQRSWPSFPLPDERGDVTASGVMAAAEGPERDAAIHAWCVSVWETFRGSEARVVALLREHGILDA